MLKPLFITGAVLIALWLIWESSVWGRRTLQAVLVGSVLLWGLGVTGPQESLGRLLAYNACESVDTAIVPVLEAMSFELPSDRFLDAFYPT